MTTTALEEATELFPPSQKYCRGITSLHLKQSKNGP
jgi:hypothetical protein